MTTQTTEFGTNTPRNASHLSQDPHDDGSAYLFVDEEDECGLGVGEARCARSGGDLHSAAAVDSRRRNNDQGEEESMDEVTGMAG